MGVTEGTTKDNFRHIKYDTSKVCIGDNSFISGEYTNPGYAETLAAGTIMGRVAATQALVPLQSDASDGSQYPVGILPEDQYVADYETVSLSICNSGKIDSTLLVFEKAGDSLATLVSSRSLRDRLQGVDINVQLFGATENTDYDNDNA